MTADLRATVLGLVARIAPEVDLAGVPDDADLREEVDLDSIDFLDLMLAIHETLGVDVPEQDYPQCSTLGGLLAYLAARR